MAKYSADSFTEQQRHNLAFTRRSATFSRLRLLAFALCTALLVACYHAFGTAAPLPVASSLSQTSKMSSGSVDKLKVSLHQTSASPVKIAIKVTNEHSKPMTFYTYESPLDELVFKLGLVQVTPKGASEPVHVDAIQLRRIMPPPAECIVTLKPGESKEKSLDLTEEAKDVVPDLSKGASVQLRGNWMSVWEGAQDDLKDKDGEMPEDKALSGPFQSNKMELN